MEGRLKKLKGVALKEIEVAVKSGNSTLILKNAEILKKTELLIKDFSQIKAQLITLEQQTNSATDPAGTESNAKERSGSELIQKRVTSRISSEATGDQIGDLKIDIDTQLNDLFSEPS